MIYLIHGFSPRLTAVWSHHGESACKLWSHCFCLCSGVYMLYYVNRSNWNRAGTDRRRRLIHNVKRCGSRRVAESKNHMSNVLGCNKKLLKFAPKNLPNWNWLRRGTSFWRSMLTVRKTLRIAKMTSDQLCCCVRRTDILLRMYKDDVNFVEEQHAKCNWRRDGKSEAHKNGAARCWSKNLKIL